MRETSRKHYKWLTDDSVTRLPLWTLRGRGWLVLYCLRPAGVGVLFLSSSCTCSGFRLVVVVMLHTPKRQ